MPLTTRLREWRRDRALLAATRRDTTPPPPTAYARFGRGSVVHGPARITRPDCIVVGDDVVVLERAWLSVVEAHPGRPPRLVLGDRVRLGRGNNVACIGEVVFEDDVVAADNVFVGDCYHEYRQPDVPILHQPMSEPEPVRIGAGAYLGTGCIVLPGVTVGARAYVGEGAVVTTDVPAGTHVSGSPAAVAGSG